jgi:carbon-monoxide dehydrogenase small subunit
MAKKIHISTIINDKEVEFLSEPYQTLLEVLRENLGLTGTKEGCGNGNCGACSVIIDGVLVNSCLVLAVEVQGKSVTTIEGIAQPHGLHPIQKEFLKQDAVQCGFCTPGMIMSAKSLLDHNPSPSETEIRYWMSGNLCRCTGYDKIVRAVQTVAEQMEKEGMSSR